MIVLIYSSLKSYYFLFFIEINAAVVKKKKTELHVFRIFGLVYMYNEYVCVWFCRVLIICIFSLVL